MVDVTGATLGSLLSICFAAVSGCGARSVPGMPEADAGADAAVMATHCPDGSGQPVRFLLSNVAAPDTAVLTAFPDGQLEVEAEAQDWWQPHVVGQFIVAFDDQFAEPAHGHFYGARDFQELFSIDLPSTYTRNGVSCAFGESRMYFASNSAALAIDLESHSIAGESPLNPGNWPDPEVWGCLTSGTQVHFFMDPTRDPEDPDETHLVSLDGATGARIEPPIPLESGPNRSIGGGAMQLATGTHVFLVDRSRGVESVDMESRRSLGFALSTDTVGFFIEGIVPVEDDALWYALGGGSKTIRVDPRDMSFAPAPDHPSVVDSLMALGPGGTLLLTAMVPDSPPAPRYSCRLWDPCTGGVLGEIETEYRYPMRVP